MVIFSTQLLLYNGDLVVYYVEWIILNLPNILQNSIYKFVNNLMLQVLTVNFISSHA